MAHRVLLATVPGVLRDVLRSVLDADPGAEIIAASAVPPPPDPEPDAPPPVVVCMSASEVAEHALQDLLALDGRARVVVLEDDGRTGVLHELVLRSTPLGNLSPERLRDAVRPPARSEAPAADNGPEPARADVPFFASVEAYEAAPLTEVASALMGLAFAGRLHEPSPEVLRERLDEAVAARVGSRQATQVTAEGVQLLERSGLVIRAWSVGHRWAIRPTRRGRRALEAGDVTGALA